MSDFSTDISEVLSLPDLEDKMTRHSKILFDLSMPDQVHKHAHTYAYYKKELIALTYEFTKIKGANALTNKLDTMLDKIEKLRDLELKREK